MQQRGRRLKGDEPAVKRTFIDRAVGYFSPEAGLRRLAARAALTRAVTFEGATKGRRTKGWRPGNESINTAIVGSLPTLRARARDLVRNNAWAFGAVDAVVSETIGAGIIPQAKGPDDLAVAAAEGIWIEWGDTVACDADGLLNFYGIQSLAMKTIAEAGSVLIRRRSRRLTDGLPLPMQLQVLEPEYLDTNRDTYAPSEGKVILGGIQFDLLGRRQGYWIFREPPGINATYLRPLDSVFVPASEILHIYRVDRAGQVDGIPWAAPVIIKLRDLDEYEDAELVRQKIAACFAAFRTQMEPLDDQTGATQAETDALGRIEPGAIEILQPGESITFGTPPQSNGYKEHVPWQLRAVARSFGVTYEACTGDFSQVNFSSGRMGRLQMNRNVKRWQDQIVIPRLCQTVWSWAMDAAVVAGRLGTPVGAVWTVPKVEMIDPAAETAALRDQIRSGFTTLSEVIRSTGRDPAEVFDERQKDDAALDKAGIVLDSDPRKRSAQGNYTGEQKAAAE